MPPPDEEEQREFVCSHCLNTFTTADDEDLEVMMGVCPSCRRRERNQSDREEKKRGKKNERSN